VSCISCQYHGLITRTDMHHISKQSCYLVGRDRLVSWLGFSLRRSLKIRQVCDLPIDHPSASKQHAVIQFRQVSERNEFGDVKMLIKSVLHAAPAPADQSRPFIIDLESANGTTVNEEKIPESRFFELRTGDSESFFALGAEA
jgi:smad nuclear-interacting protein 1